MNFKPITYFQRILPIDMPASAKFIYAHSGTMNQHHDGDNFYPLFRSYNSEAVADDVIVVGDHDSSKYILVGALTAYRSLTHLSAVWRGRKLCEIKVWQPEIKEGETPEELLVLEGNDWRKLLLEYGNKVAERMNAIRPPADVDTITGYCSWYYYYKEVTEKNFLDNVDILAEKQSSPFKARYIQIDDGYQTFQGDWNDQHKNWPTPLIDIAKKIKDGGMEAGIWTMPFHASTASRVFNEHPEWFVKGTDGKPQVARGWSPEPDHLWATLDTTQPAVLEHLKKIFRTFREWGYTYFKMDGLGFALLDGVRADPNATAVSAFRQGLQAIREAVPDSFLLACSQHFLPCVGIVDGARFSEDTHASTIPILRAAYQTFGRYWMFDKFYWADPDCLIARDDRGTQTIGESRISVLTGILTGFALTSDNLSVMPDERIELLGRATQFRMRDVMPAVKEVEWLDPGIASYSGTINGRPTLALINFKNESKTWKLGEIEGFSSDKTYKELLADLGEIKGEITVPARDAVLLME